MLPCCLFSAVSSPPFDRKSTDLCSSYLGYLHCCIRSAIESPALRQRPRCCTRPATQWSIIPSTCYGAMRRLGLSISKIAGVPVRLYVWLARAATEIVWCSLPSLFISCPVSIRERCERRERLGMIETTLCWFDLADIQLCKPVHTLYSIKNLIDAIG